MLFTKFGQIVLGLFVLLLVASSPLAANIKYVYDDQHRLVRIVNNINVVDYVYDNVGNRVVKIVTAQPIGQFIGLPTTGISPLSVSFTDQSTGTVTSWLWDFGDGSTSTLQNPTHIYHQAGVYSVTLMINGTTAVTKNNLITVTTPQKTLTVAITGDGGGSVNSAPKGIACTYAPLAGVCSAPFDFDSDVTLTALPDGHSLFSWGDVCLGTGTCLVKISDKNDVSATFTFIKPAQIGTTPYDSLSAAYLAATPAGTVIKTRAYTFIGDLVVDKSLMIKGGFNPSYSAQIGATTINGKLTIGKGSLVADRLNIR